MDALNSVWGWIKGVLDYLLAFRGKQNAKLLFLGLENAGKTTLMGRLKSDKMVQAQPTLLPQSESLTYGNITFTAFDLGGHEQARRVWREYFPVADGIVFLVDATDKATLQTSSMELNNILCDENMQEVPVVVLVNKIDSQGAVGVDEITCRFGLVSHITGKNSSRKEIGDRRPFEVFPTSVLMRQGYGDALRWLARYLD